MFSGVDSNFSFWNLRKASFNASFFDGGSGRATGVDTSFLIRPAAGGKFNTIGGDGTAQDISQL